MNHHPFSWFMLVKEAPMIYSLSSLYRVTDSYLYFKRTLSAIIPPRISNELVTGGVLQSTYA